jgi:type I restriction enzyme S subunit
MKQVAAKNKVMEEGKPFYNTTIPTDWNVSTVGEAFEICNNLRFPISEEERKKIQGPFPYYGPTRIQDYINNYRIEGKYVLIGEDGDHFLKWKELPMTLLVEGKFNVNNHAHVIKGSNNLTEWFFYYFNHKELTPYLTRQGAGRYKLTKQSLEKIPIPLPDFEEQKSITAILKSCDVNIEVVEQLITQKVLRKKWLMQQLLTGKKRLKGFSGEWNKCNASDFLSQRNEQAPNNGNIPLFSLTIENGVTEKSDRYEREFLVKDKSIKNYKIVYPNDMVFNPANLRWGAIAKHSRTFKVLLSPIYEVLTVKHGYDINFISYLVSSPRQIAYYASILEGTLIERMAVKVEPFLATNYEIPEIEEQIAIAQVLQAADKEISLLKLKAEKLKEKKKGLMQQLLTGKIRVK